MDLWLGQQAGMGVEGLTLKRYLPGTQAPAVEGAGAEVAVKFGAPGSTAVRRALEIGLPIVLAGYALFGRGFAYVASIPGTPPFAGELILMAGVTLGTVLVGLALACGSRHQDSCARRRRPRHIGWAARGERREHLGRLATGHSAERHGCVSRRLMVGSDQVGSVVALSRLRRWSARLSPVNRGVLKGCVVGVTAILVNAYLDPTLESPR
jgi:hypothetical protein